MPPRTASASERAPRVTGLRAPSERVVRRQRFHRGYTSVQLISDQPMSLSFANPSCVHAPLGLYSHVVSVPEGTELLFISGQLGVRPDGTTPSTIAEQAEQVFSNIVALLRTQGLGPTDIIKLTTFMVAGQDGDAVRAARLKYLGSHRPASTAVFVSALVDPAWFVEVEAIAARRKSGDGVDAA